MVQSSLAHGAFSCSAISIYIKLHHHERCGTWMLKSSLLLIFCPSDGRLHSWAAGLWGEQATSAPPIDFSVRVIVEPHTIEAFEGKNEVNDWANQWQRLASRSGLLGPLKGGCWLGHFATQEWNQYGHKVWLYRSTFLCVCIDCKMAKLQHLLSYMCWCKYIDLKRFTSQLLCTISSINRPFYFSGVPKLN